MRILWITSEWPDEVNPGSVPFLVQQVDTLRQTGIEVEVYSFRGAKNPLNYLKAWFDVRSRYCFQHFDLIHAHWGQSGLLAIPVSIPLVVTYHGSDLQGIVGRSSKNKIISKISMVVSRIVFHYAKRVIVVSERLKLYLPQSEKINVIPGGIDLNNFRPLSQKRAKEQLGFSMKKNYVLFPADPQRKVKRYSLAKQAIALLERGFDLEMIALSGVPHSAVPLYMNACDVLVLTSHHEGSPTVIKEALACDLPIVSVDVGDVRERIGNIQGCVLCERDDPETIARGVEKVLRRGKRIKGRESIHYLDKNRIARRIIEVYQAAVA